jgi:hypothetical protein
MNKNGSKRKRRLTHLCRGRRVLVKSFRALLLRAGALRITPHAAARMAVVAMMMVRCDVEVVRHAFNVSCVTRRL